MEKPSFKSSPWIRGAPHRVFSRDIRRTRWRISLDTGGRPGFPRRDFHVQKSLNPLRCQPMTVSGLTITRAWRQPGHRQDRMTQKTLSAFRSNGRGLFRFRTATCCRRARISVWSAARSAKISMILCMPERVSGGDAKFQGFCDGWNKWEGQGRSDAPRRSLSGSVKITWDRVEEWIFSEERNLRERGFRCLALVEADSARVHDLLFRCLKTENDSTVVTAILHFLATYSGAIQAASLAETDQVCRLTKSEFGNVRRAAARALRSFPTMEVVTSALIEQYQQLH